MRKKTFFMPYMGKSALTQGYKGERILIIGNSHYCGECVKCGVHGMTHVSEMERCRNFTQDRIGEYLAYKKGEMPKKKWMNTFENFEKALLGSTNPSLEESLDLWDRICFCNFIQTAYLENSSQRYPKEDYLKSQPHIKEIIDEIKPTKIITWGFSSQDEEIYPTVYPYMMPENWTDYNDSMGWYDWNGNKIWMLRIPHPSVAFSPSAYFSILEDFLSKK